MEKKEEMSRNFEISYYGSLEQLFGMKGIRLIIKGLFELICSKIKYVSVRKVD